MEAKKLKANLEKLKQYIPLKPSLRTDDFPKDINESLHKYLRQRTLSTMRCACWIYDKNNWPLPLFVDPKMIRIGYMNEFMFTKVGMNSFRYFDLFSTLQTTKHDPYEMKPRFLLRIMWLLRYRKRKRLEYYDWLTVPILCSFFRVTNIDDFNIQLFQVNYKYFKLKILNNDLLLSKKKLLAEILNNYEKGNYASSICTLYPIIDFLTRQYFDTTKFDKDIVSINAVFKAAGFSLIDIDNLKPGAATHKLVDLAVKKEITWDEVNKLSKKNEYSLGFPGIALSSFLHFSNQYYQYHRSDSVNTNKLNRHAILHGSANDFGTKLNAIKLFTYLYLMLELEPVLKIVFNER